MERLLCPRCGAANKPDAQWCTVCLERFEQAPEPEPAAGRPEARPDEFIGPPMPQQWSRWQRSEVTFGPVGRILMTLLVTLPPVVMGFGYSPIFALIWIIAVLPPALASIWKRVPVR